MAATVRDMLTREMKDTITFEKTVMWTDSETLIKWIRDRKTRFKTFVKNRLTKIHELTNVEEWRYVPSQDNPADDCSRGLDPGDKKWERFYRGPKFLWQPEANWPEQRYITNRTPISMNAITVREPEPFHKRKLAWVLQIASRIEKWPGKVRRIALFCNFLRKWKVERNKVKLTQVFPTLADLAEAQNLLIGAIQQKAFANELERLNKPTKVEEIPEVTQK